MSNCSFVLKNIKLRPETSWYSDELRSGRNIRRKVEITWYRTSLMVPFEIYWDLCRKMNTLFFEENKCFYSTKIEEYGKDQKKIVNLTKMQMLCLMEICSKCVDCQVDNNQVSEQVM